MIEILVRAGCFIAVIFLGYCLRRIGFFKEGDFDVLAKIVIKITLPAAIVVSCSGKEMSPSMLVISLFGLGGGILYMAAAYLATLHKTGKERAFGILNCSGYNIGNFTMPFVQSFLGPVGVMVTSLFDTGNAFVCLGGAYSIASMAQGGGGGFSLKPIVKKLVVSIPFDTYIVMTALGVLHLSLPKEVVSFAAIIADANVFLAMLMIGVGFKLSGDRTQLGTIVQVLGIRYGVALALSLAFYFLLPFPLEYRQAMAILVFAPIASTAPPYTSELDGDTGLSSAINSLSIVISIVCIVTTVVLVL